MRSRTLFALALFVAVFLWGCGTPGTEHAATATDDAVAVAERATAMTARSGDAGSEKSQVDPSTAVAYAATGGATAIAAPGKAIKDGQNTTTGNVQTGIMLAGATDSQMVYATAMIENDKSLQSIGAQIDTLLVTWSAEGGQTAANATMLTELRTSYETRFDALSKLGQAAMPQSVDFSKLSTLGVFNWSSGYAVGAEQKPMSDAEAVAARGAAIAQWQAIKAIATESEDDVVDGGEVPPTTRPAE